MKRIFVIILSILAVAGLTFVIGMSTKNGAIAREEAISTSKSDIVVYEKRRGDLIPNLVECVKAYSKHEYDTLMSVIKARGENESVSDSTVNEVMSQIKVVAEQYPQLKADNTYKELMNELATTENYIARYRNEYNAKVRDYKQYNRSFPSHQILDMLGYEPINVDYLDFEVSEDAPKVNFD